VALQGLAIGEVNGLLLSGRSWGKTPDVTVWNPLLVEGVVKGIIANGSEAFKM